MRNHTRLMLCLVSLAFAQLSSIKTSYAYKKALQKPSTSAASTAGSKPPLAYTTGDLQVALIGKSKLEYFFARNNVLFNNELPDQYNFFRHLADIGLDVSWGQEKYGHKAVEWFIDVRQRNAWGDTGKYIQTSRTAVKAGDSIISDHNHKMKLPLLWVRDLWLQTSVNALFNADNETLHFIKAGLFPFEIGRGISLGVYYGSSKEFLGVYTDQNDQSAPGFLFHGELIKDRLSYDLYYSKFEEKGSSLGDTFNLVKANHLGKKARPWRGVSKDNDLWALCFNWKALSRRSSGDLNLQPYVLYNEASDQYVEFDADAKSQLGTAGLALEYTYKDFEIGGEIAFNFGREKLYNIDRNTSKIQIDPTSGQLIEAYTKINNGNSPATKANAAEILATEIIENGASFGPSGNPTKYTNATDRFRPGYTNHYRGWMGVIDAAYTYRKWDLKGAVAYGYASGDSNPHDQEVSKNYKGWVGLNENYSGVRVPSVLVLDARKLARPLNVSGAIDDGAGNDNSFADMHYAGLGLNWFPVYHNQDKLSLSTNALFYWKASGSFKYNADQGAFSTTDKASSYLGVELNAMTRYELLKDLSFEGDFALFFPGTYYKDVKGLKISGVKFTELQLSDTDALVDPVNNYGINDHTASYLRMCLVYKF